MAHIEEEIHFLVEEIENNINRQLDSMLFQMKHPEAKKNLAAVHTFTRALIETVRPRVAPGVKAQYAKLQHATTVLQQFPRTIAPTTTHPTAAKPVQTKTTALSKPAPKTTITLISDKTTKKELAIATFDDMTYELHEPPLDAVMMKVITACKEYSKKIKKFIEKDKREKLFKLVNKIARTQNTTIPQEEFWKFRYYLIRNLLRYGIIDALLHDDAITKIVCTGVQDPVVIERNSKRLRTNVLFRSKDQLNRLIKRIAARTGQKISMEDPVLDATFKDFRIQATLGTDYAQPSFTMTRVATK